jgi:hypothetical protein
VTLVYLAAILAHGVQEPLRAGEKEAPGNATASPNLKLELREGAVYEYQFKAERRFSRGGAAGEAGAGRGQAVEARVRVEVLPGSRVSFRILDWSADAGAGGVRPPAAKDAVAAGGKEKRPELPGLTVEVGADGEVKQVGDRERPGDDTMALVHDVYEAFALLLWRKSLLGDPAASREDPGVLPAGGDAPDRPQVEPKPGRRAVTRVSVLGQCMRYLGKEAGKAGDLASFVVWLRSSGQIGERKFDEVLDIGKAAYRLADGFLQSIEEEVTTPDSRLVPAGDREKKRFPSHSYRRSIVLSSVTVPGK